MSSSSVCLAKLKKKVKCKRPPLDAGTFCEEHLCPLCSKQKSAIVDTCYTCDPRRAHKRLAALIETGEYPPFEKGEDVPPQALGGAPPVPGGAPPPVPGGAPPPVPGGAPPPVPGGAPPPVPGGAPPPVPGGAPPPVPGGAPPPVPGGAPPPVPGGAPPPVPGAPPPVPSLPAYAFSTPLPAGPFEDSPTPQLLVACCEWLLAAEKRLCEEGLFRIPGNLSDVNTILAGFAGGADVDLSGVTDPHLVTGVIKHYYRRLDPPIFPRPLVPHLQEAAKIEDSHARAGALQQICDLLPAGQRGSLKVSMHLFHNIVRREGQNCMSLSNMAACIGPSMLGDIENLHQCQMILSTLIANQAALFGG